MTILFFLKPHPGSPGYLLGAGDYVPEGGKKKRKKKRRRVYNIKKVKRLVIAEPADFSELATSLSNELSTAEPIRLDVDKRGKTWEIEIRKRKKKTSDIVLLMRLMEEL